MIAPLEFSRNAKTVFGEIAAHHWGGLAEYVCAREACLAPKPANLTFEQAAAVPMAALTALQALRDKGNVQPGQQVLIHGSGGGVGTFAVQLAKLYGAEVTGVDDSGKQDFLRALGADHVIDYTREDFTRNGQQYDLILDLVAYRSAYAYARALNDNGHYYCVGGSVATLVQVLLLGPWIRRTTGKQVRVLAVQPNLQDLVYVTELCTAGKLAVVIDREYTLHEVPEALRYLGEGRVKGKVVITLERGDQ